MKSKIIQKFSFLAILTVVFLLAFSGDVSADGHCGGLDGDGNPIYGIEIQIDGEETNGGCYDCGDVDGVCPSDYGVDCLGDAGIIDYDCGNLAYWTNAGGDSINSVIAVLGTTTINLNLINSVLNPEDIVSFEIYEKDSMVNDDIKTISGGVIDGDRNVLGISLTVTEEDINKAWKSWGLDEEGSINDDFEFYFRVLDSDDNTIATSNELNLTVLSVTYCIGKDRCSDYTDPTICGSDPCDFDVVPSGESCDTGAYTGCTTWADCGCFWDAATTECKSSREVVNCDEGAGSISSIGLCSYTESTDDDCSDGFLSYSWTALWEWDDENGGVSPPCTEGYVLYDDGSCYYDPTGQSGNCVDGSNTVQCPAQIQLPFFNAYSIIAIIVLIGLGYYMLISKEKKHKKKR